MCSERTGKDRNRRDGVSGADLLTLFPNKAPASTPASIRCIPSKCVLGWVGWKARSSTVTPTSHSYTLSTNQWYVCEVEVDDPANTINVWVDGHPANTDVSMSATPNGYVGVGSYGSTHTTEFDYIQVFGGQRAAKAVALMAVTPVRDGLLSNYPNPFNPTTTMRYQMRKSGPGPLQCVGAGHTHPGERTSIVGGATGGLGRTGRTGTPGGNRQTAILPFLCT